MELRNVREADYEPIVQVVNEWWGGRDLAPLLQRLFFKFFQPTSFVIEHEGQIVAFLIGFISQTDPEKAYIHFVGVHPDHRRQKLGEELYLHFFQTTEAKGCHTISCVTSPVNTGSIAFHLRMGFTPVASTTQSDGIHIQPNYDGQGGDRVLFEKRLA